MGFLALALDFDGTIAQNHGLECVVQQAIIKLRSRDIVVLLPWPARRLDSPAHFRAINCVMLRNTS